MKKGIFGLCLVLILLFTIVTSAFACPAITITKDCNNVTVSIPANNGWTVIEQWGFGVFPFVDGQYQVNASVTWGKDWGWLGWGKGWGWKYKETSTSTELVKRRKTCSTPTPTATATDLPTDTPTNTPTDTATSTATATDTATATLTNTPTDTATATLEDTPTNTPETPTLTNTATETIQPSVTATATKRYVLPPTPFVEACQDCNGSLTWEEMYPSVDTGKVTELWSLSAKCSWFWDVVGWCSNIKENQIHTWSYVEPFSIVYGGQYYPAHLEGEVWVVNNVPDYNGKGFPVAGLLEGDFSWLDWADLTRLSTKEFFVCGAPQWSNAGDVSSWFLPYSYVIAHQ
jgi:hypothetical protein